MIHATIAAQWQSYADSVLPADAPPVQVRECRQAFYAGVWGMLQAFAEIGEDTVSEEEGVRRLTAWNREVERFYQGVRYADS